MEDGCASVLFDDLLSDGCVGRDGDPEFKKGGKQTNE